jgi:hypothetical protein
MVNTGTGSRTATMNPKLLDILVCAVSLVIFVALLVVLPMAFPDSAGTAYLVALLVFIATMAGAGWLIRGAIR